MGMSIQMSLCAHTLFETRACKTRCTSQNAEEGKVATKYAHYTPRGAPLAIASKKDAVHNPALASE